MANLEEATERLQKALARLEAAAKDGGHRRLDAGVTTAEDANANIVALRDENAALQAAIDHVSGRLDHTIHHLQQILEA